MSVKPIDAQVLLHSTPDVAKLHSIQSNKDENAMTQSAQTMQKKIDQDSEQVHATEKSNKISKLDREGKKEEQGKQQKKKKQKDEQQTSTIDIRI